MRPRRSLNKASDWLPRHKPVYWAQNEPLFVRRPEDKIVYKLAPHVPMYLDQSEYPVPFVRVSLGPTKSKGPITQPLPPGASSSEPPEEPPKGPLSRLKEIIDRTFLSH